MIDAIRTSLASLQAGSRQIEQSATRLASGAADTATMIEDIVSIKTAQTRMEASMSMIKANNDMAMELVRILDTRA